MRIRTASSRSRSIAVAPPTGCISRSAAHWRSKPEEEGAPGGMPDFALERGCDGIVCGIDEAGRGPLAGPVVAAAVILDRKKIPRRLRAELYDSKKLNAEEREEFALMIRQCAIKVGVGAASVREIERINILQATFVAMRRALMRMGVMPDIALIDGN